MPHLKHRRGDTGRFHTGRFHMGRVHKGLTLLEMVVSMGLLSLLMLPVISLLATSTKVYQASSLRGEGDYLRNSTLDAVALAMHGAERVTTADSTFVEVVFADGSQGRLAYGGGQLTWSRAGVLQTLASGLAGARFSFGTASGAGPAAGQLMLLELASQGPGEPQPVWSSSRFWIRPAL